MQLNAVGRDWVEKILEYFYPEFEFVPTFKRTVLEAFAADILEPPPLQLGGYRKAFLEAVSQDSAMQGLPAANVGACWLWHYPECREWGVVTDSIRNVHNKALVINLIYRRAEHFRQLLAVEQRQLSSSGSGMHDVRRATVPLSTLRGEPDTPVRIDTRGNSGRTYAFRRQLGTSFWEQARFHADDRPTVVLRPSDTEADSTPDPSL